MQVSSCANSSRPLSTTPIILYGRAVCFLRAKATQLRLTATTLQATVSSAGSNSKALQIPTYGIGVLIQFRRPEACCTQVNSWFCLRTNNDILSLLARGKGNRRSDCLRGVTLFQRASVIHREFRCLTFAIIVTSKCLVPDCATRQSFSWPSRFYRFDALGAMVVNSASGS